MFPLLTALLFLPGTASSAQEAAPATPAPADDTVGQLRRGVRLIYVQRYAVKRHDLETGATTTLVAKLDSEWQPYALSPADPTQLLARELERLIVVDTTDGSVRTLVEKPKIEHPGCGHIESALGACRWIDNGARVWFGYREVPEGVDPHTIAPSQFRKASVPAAGGDIVELGQQASMGDEPPAFDPSGSRAILTRTHKGEGGESAVEVVVKQLRDDTETSIVTLSSKSLEGVIARWSPDGSRILIIHRRRGPGRVQHIGLHVWDGAECRLIDDSPGRMGLGGTGGYTTQWSPDSTRIAFIRIKSPGIAPQAIEVWDLKERTRVAVWADPRATGATPCAPRWFADNRRLAWVAYTCPGKGYHQHRFAGCTTELRWADCAQPKEAPRLATTDGVTYRPAHPTPDGRHLLYFRETARTTKGKGDFWDDVTSRTVELAAVDLATGAIHTLSRTPEFEKVDAVRFFFNAK
jgi:hypothetical protein